MRSELVMRWLDRLLVVELVMLTVLLGCFLDRDMDIWWHLRAGREILAGLGIPRIDSYLFAVTGAEWIDLHWGFQVAAAWLFEHGGFAALTLAAAMTAGIAIAIALAATVPERSAIAVVWCWLPAVFVMSARFYPRPEILSLVCLAAYLCVLRQADRRPRALWLLVPIQLVWVNVQGLFVLGPIVLGCWVIDRALGGGGASGRREWREQWAAPTAVAIACFANPYTWKGVLFPLTLVRRISVERGFYGQHIGELMSIPDMIRKTGISSVYLRIALVLLVATAVSFALQRNRARHFYFRLLLFLLFAGAGLLAGRNQPQFALVAGAVLAWNLSDWLATRPASPLIERAVGRILTSAVVVGLILWVATGRFYAYAGEGRAAGLGEHPLWYAHDAARFAARTGMPPYFIAYHEGQAAVLEFHMRPDQKVFVDPRLEVSPRAALQHYYELAADMIHRHASWPERLHGLPQPLGFLVDHVSYHGVEAALLADGRWRCIWFDAVAGVYVPSTETRLVEQHAVDFGARYFAGNLPSAGGTPPTASPVTLAAASKKAESLFSVGRDLLAAEPADRHLGRILMLQAMADARAVVNLAPRSPRLASLLASASLSLYPAPAREAPIANVPLEAMLGVARARFLLNRAVQQSPADFQSWLALYGIADALGDPDALWAAGIRLAELRPTNAAEFELQRRVRVMLRHLIAVRAAEAPLTLPVEASDVLTTAQDLFARRRFLRALDFVERSLRDGVGLPSPPAELTDLRGRLLLIAGDPGRARTVWTEASTPGGRSSALRRRLANTSFVEGRLPEAADAYRASLSSDPAQSAARYGLAIAYLEGRQTEEFVRECRSAVRAGDLPADQAEWCREMAAVAEEYARARPHLPADGGGDRR